MPHLDCSGHRLELNEEGFLLHPEEWNDEVAQALAKSQEWYQGQLAEIAARYTWDGTVYAK